MRRTLLAPTAAVLAVTGLLAGCSSDNSAAPTTGESAGTASTATAGDTADPAAAAPVLDSGLPPQAMPEVPGGREAQEACPYLDSQWVADTNGQRMTGQGIDQRFDTPACVFWSYPPEPQLTVIVRHMPSPQEAVAVVDWAAPVADTEPASKPAGWDGGRFGGTGPEGQPKAIYAVAKDTVAVVVFSNQEQSFKAEQVATKVIENLGL